MLCRFLLMVFLSVVCTSAGAMPGDPPADGAHVSLVLAGRVLKLAVHAKALEGNRLGDPAGRSFIVYLPPSYDYARDDAIR